MRRHISWANFLKYIALPNFLMASANTYKNFFYNDKNGAGNLRILIEQDIKKRQQATEQLIDRKKQIIEYQEDILNNQDGVNKMKAFWEKIFELNKDYKIKTEKASEVIKNAIESAKTDQLSKEDIEEVRKSLEDMEVSGNNLNNSMVESNKSITEILDEISKRSSGGGNTGVSNFLNDYSWRIDDLIPEIDMSNLTHSIAIVNFFGCLIILLCLITILSAFYGNKIILYFDLENKYPSLAKFIRLRIKFQNYTIIFNFVLLTFVLINQMIINFIVLFNSI